MNNYVFLWIDLLDKCIAEEYPESESCIQYIYRDIRIIRKHENTDEILDLGRLKTEYFIFILFNFIHPYIHFKYHR